MKRSCKNICDGKNLKLLAITSSFGLNTTQYLYDIAKAEGFTDVIVGRLYGSGCTLQKHWGNAQNGHKYYQYTKKCLDAWSFQPETPFLHGLLDEDWDIIYLQQSADQAPFPETYQSENVQYITELVQFIRRHLKKTSVRFVWNQTWAFQADCVRGTFEKLHNDQMEMYNAIVKATKEKILPREEFEVIIPTGTALQNVRTSLIGDTLTEDGLHLNKKGYIIAGYTVFCALTGRKMTDIRMKIASKGATENNPLSLSEREKLSIIECVNNALENPFQVTPSFYKD